MNWADMDYEERLQALWRRTRDGLLVKQIATELGTVPSIINEFARAEGMSVRQRVPGLRKVKVPARKQAAVRVIPTINTTHSEAVLSRHKGA